MPSNESSYVCTGGKHYAVGPREQTPGAPGFVMLVTLWAPRDPALWRPADALPGTEQ